MICTINGTILNHTFTKETVFLFLVYLNDRMNNYDLEIQMEIHPVEILVEFLGLLKILTGF